MDRSDRRASDVGRRASTRRSLALSTGSSRDDEEYDLSAIAVADGFRPDASSHTGSASTSQPTIYSHYTSSNSYTDTDPDSDPSHVIPQLPPSLADISSKQQHDRPSSITKPRQAHDSLTLRNDGSSPAASRTIAAATVTVATPSPLMRVESPYRGPSGPSHPYHMYPQRAHSNASASTAGAAVERSDALRGPAHPYALYTQATVPVEETQEEHIPVGFHGMGNNYQRQLGPDGEEAGDLIGPLGHTEELPPYTRYPTAFVRKNSVEGNDAGPPQLTIAGAGGIGIATRNPEFSSDDDLALSRSRPSIRSATSEASQHDINTAAREMTEKPAMGKWQRRAKKKMWGIVPYWAICLLVAGLVMMGIVMGAVIGTMLSRDNDGGGHPPPPNYDTDRTSNDVEPMGTVPDDLVPLPTGFFALPEPLDVKHSPNLCFNDTTQSAAWSCDVPARYYQMEIELVEGAADTESYEIVLNAIDPADAKIVWGTAPPMVRDPVRLTLVNDTFEQDRGPAWWLNMTYDKVVMVKEDSFSAMRRRDWDYAEGGVANFDPSLLSKADLGAQPGDKPWKCTWPRTTLELFLYPNENIVKSTTTGGSTPTTTAYGAAATETSGYDAKTLPSYPSVIKFLERRRAANSPATTASCAQVQILEDGYSMGSVVDDNGKPIVVPIIEKDDNSLQERWIQNQRNRHARSWVPESLFSRELELTECGCLWMSH